jgi:prolyl-tRNA synthetase
MASLYAEFAQDVAALPVVVGRRPASGRLPGAAASFTVDAMVGGGAALQVAQSHNLADNYSRALGVPYSGSSSEEEGEEQADFLSQMGSGLRASLLGAVALVHGDDAGLVLPPSLAPLQVVITPILTRACDSKLLAAEAERIRAALAEAGVRVAVDGRRLKPAARFRASEQLGVPLRLELGPADIAPGTCVLARRTVPGRAGKLRGVSTEAGALAAAVLDLLGDMQTEACGNAAEALQTGIVDVSSFYELRVGLCCAVLCFAAPL